MPTIPPRFIPAFYALIGASLALNIVWFVNHARSDSPATPTTAVLAAAPMTPPATVSDPLGSEPQHEASDGANEIVAPTVHEVTAPLANAVTSAPAVDALPAPVAGSTALPAAAAQVAAAPAPASAPDTGGVRVVRTSIVGSIPQSLATVAAPLGDAVSAATARLMMWDLDLRRDLRRDDPLEVAYTVSAADEVTIVAAKLGSGRLGQTLTAYRFHASGDRYPGYWTADGEEVERRLRNTPIRDYEQITSLLRDRPDHHGVDFKSPTGTEVYTPFDGVVTRVNWNWNYNGNCIEVQHTDGVLAKYLHLSENRVQAGDRVRAGQLIALSGNTGRSSGPHLHYQLNRGREVLDPLDVHGTTRRSLPEADREAFQREVARIDALMAASERLARN